MLSVSMLCLCLGFPPSTVEVPKTGFPQWQGVHRDGKALDTGLFAKWPESGPKLAWENLKIGIGYGSPVVHNGKLYILGGEDNKPGSTEWLSCLNTSDGKEVWKVKFETAPGNFNAGWGGGPRSTPTLAGEFVYVLGATGDLFCLKQTDGSQVWMKNLVKDFGGKIPVWGYSESPLIDSGHVVVTPGNKTSMVALNAQTGEKVWACEEPNDAAGYSSIVPTKVGTVPVYIQQTMASAIGVRATDGKLLFKTGSIGRRIAVIPTPVVADGYAFFTAGYGAGCECFKLTPDGDGVKAEQVYTNNKNLANHHGGVVRVGDYVYGHSDAGGWTCLPFKQTDAEPVWQHQKFGKGSILFADGHLLCYAERSGELTVIKASPDGWKEVGKMSLPKKSPTDKKSGAIWAHPVIADGKLYLRDFDYLFCFQLKADGA